MIFLLLTRRIVEEKEDKKVPEIIEASVRDSGKNDVCDEEKSRENDAPAYVKVGYCRLVCTMQQHVTCEL